jgi:hypothetical protein
VDVTKVLVMLLGGVRSEIPGGVGRRCLAVCLSAERRENTRETTSPPACIHLDCLAHPPLPSNMTL